MSSPVGSTTNVLQQFGLMNSFLYFFFIFGIFCSHNNQNVKTHTRVIPFLTLQTHTHIRETVCVCFPPRVSGGLSRNGVVRPHESHECRGGHSITSRVTAQHFTARERMEAAGGDAGEGARSAFGFSGVKLSQGALRDPLQHLFGEDPHELPADVQSLKHAPVLVGTWTHKRSCVDAERLLDVLDLFNTTQDSI